MESEPSGLAWPNQITLEGYIPVKRLMIPRAGDVKPCLGLSPRGGWVGPSTQK
jgi:hypothetical protein